MGSPIGLEDGVSDVFFIALIAGGLAGALVAKRGGVSLPGVRGLSAPVVPYPVAQLVPVAGNPATAQRIRVLRDRIARVWPDASGHPGPVSPAAMENMLAQAGAEGTGYGQGWSGDMAGSNNVGSYQVGSAPRQTSYYHSVDHVDHKPNGTEYTTAFRYYHAGKTPDGKDRDAGDAGAWDFVHSITVKPFRAIEAIESGAVLEYVFRQGVNGYFDGWDPDIAMGGNVKDYLTRWAASIAWLIARDPAAMARRAAKVRATPERVAGRMCVYAKAMGKSLPGIAQALGQERVFAILPADLK